MKEFSYTLTAEHGLHGRPAAALAQAARAYESTVIVSLGAGSADATRLIALMTLCAKRGDTVTVTVTGPDEEQAARALEQLFRETM